MYTKKNYIFHKSRKTYFKSKLFIVFLLFLITWDGKAQNVLDYSLKKTYIRKNKITCNNCFQNTLFCISKLLIDSTQKESEKNVLRKMNVKKPLEINDCVYFNPSEKYIANYSKELNQKTLFFLNYIYPDSFIKKNIELILPNSIRFYLDTSHVSSIPNKTELLLDTNYKVPLDKYLRPFYFRKFEVTNNEYREFVYWVRDSIARYLLAANDFKEFGNIETLLNWKTPIPWNSENEDYRFALEGLYLPRVWIDKHPKKKVMDTRKLNYSYYKKVNDTLVWDLINVYPDTLRWINDFSYSFNEPMTDMYFWHPAYDDYPVVGITYWQALAFLDWKTKQHQKELDAKGIKLKIEYDLPTEIEWDIASTAEKVNHKMEMYSDNYYQLADRSWLCDLSLQSKQIIYNDTVQDKIIYSSQRDNLLFDQQKQNLRYENDFIVDKTFHTSISDINKTRKKQRNNLTLSNLDANGISYMGGNVSEWLKESYQENWLPIFTKRQALLKGIKEEDAKIEAEIENYYNKKNDPNGRLVRGSNWYDERFSNKFGKNTEGTNAKIFLNPDSSHCTLGFRYVIHISKTE